MTTLYCTVPYCVVRHCPVPCIFVGVRLRSLHRQESPLELVLFHRHYFHFKHECKTPDDPPWRSKAVSQLAPGRGDDLHEAGVMTLGDSRRQKKESNKGRREDNTTVLHCIVLFVLRVCVKLRPSVQMLTPRLSHLLRWLVSAFQKE